MQYTVYNTGPMPDRCTILCMTFCLLETIIQNYWLGAISKKINNPIINMVWEMELIKFARKDGMIYGIKGFLSHQHTDAILMQQFCLSVHPSVCTSVMFRY